MIMAVIGYGVVTVAAPGSESDAGGALAPVLGLVAVALALGSFAARGVLARALAAAPGAALVPFIVAFAMAEAVAVFGLVLHFLGAPLPVSLAFFGGGLAVLALHFPLRAGGR